MDIVNYVFDIPQNNNSVSILNYKKTQLDLMLKEFFRMEVQYKENQKFIYHSHVPHNFKYFHSQIITYMNKIWSNVCYLNDSIEHKEKIDNLYSEIILKDKNYTHSLMEKTNETHNKIPELRTIYASTFFILSIFCIIGYTFMYYVTRSTATYFRTFDNYIYLLVRLLIVTTVFYCCLGAYYFIFDIIWFILKAIFNLFIWIIKFIIYIIIFIIISLVHVLKLIIMGSILFANSISQICSIIIKFIVAIPATIDNIIKFGDASIVMEEINLDLDMSFSMDSIGLGALDSIDTWLSFDWIELSIGGSSAIFLKDFGQGLTNTTNDFKNLLQNVNNDLKPINDEIANNKLQEEQLKSISQCSNKSFLQKMVLSANKDKKAFEDNKEQKKTGKQNFVKCISS
tara:strand:+ start:735 stop:1931 length:1197 start_codon:yes stop_codon:yes gene_type:complete